VICNAADLPSVAVTTCVGFAVTEALNAPFRCEGACAVADEVPWLDAEFELVPPALCSLLKPWKVKSNRLSPEINRNHNTGQVA